ncbi:hypothetical protein SADUNF_Sadunf08G0081600 [Salix dunnii]|uniref:F-box domain-containing protein n=1 Tax=Salix dunnii TaxID=1413687 RepID=A0A835JZS2_9ROSI|nr:hypothetical protein SADUNF_Sadunf08G0081600 [Salix dunnii]
MNSGVGFLPDEVIIQVLARLPVKSLFRAKTVCKLWYKLSSDKYFFQLYNEVSAKNSMVLVEVSGSSELKCCLICVDNLWGVSELTLDFLKDRVKVRASCNGLLCCSSIPDKGVYYVCNPMTREFRLLPKSRERPVTRFYPDGEATLVGLGCNLSVQKFNVVLAGYHRTFGRRPDGTFICMVFDSDTNKWRKFVSFQDDRIALMNRNRVVFVHGSLHWLTSGCSYILSLDLNCNVWRKISLPDEVIYGAGCRAHLLELDGSLSVIQISEAWMKIWVMKDYENEQWHLVDGVSLRCVRGMVPGIFPISQTSECVFLATYKQNGEHGFFASGFAHSEVEGDDPLGESRRIAFKSSRLGPSKWEGDAYFKIWVSCLKDCKYIHQAKDGDGWVEQSSQPIFFGSLQKVDAPTAYVCADSKIYDATDWYICQGMRCPANSHKPSFHVNTSVTSKHNTSKGSSSGQRSGWMLPPKMEETMTEEELFEWLQKAVQTGEFDNYSAGTSNESPSANAGNGPKSGRGGSSNGNKRKLNGKKQW